MWYSGKEMLRLVCYEGLYAGRQSHMRLKQKRGGGFGQMPTLANERWPKVCRKNQGRGQGHLYKRSDSSLNKHFLLTIKINKSNDY